MMGILTAAGFASQAVGPITLGYLYQQDGPLVAFTVMFIIMASTTIFLLIIYSRLVPYERYAGISKSQIVQ